MKLEYTGRNSRLEKAVNSANEVLTNPLFYRKVSDLEPFDNTKLSPTVIAQRINDWEKPVKIRTYWRPFGKSNAKTGSSSSISVNKAKLKRLNKFIVNTMVHEYVHAVDFGEDGKLEFTHVDNNNHNGDEDNTAPWAIGKIAQEMVESK